MQMSSSLLSPVKVYIVVNSEKGPPKNLFLLYITKCRCNCDFLTSKIKTSEKLDSLCYDSYKLNISLSLRSDDYKLAMQQEEHIKIYHSCVTWSFSVHQEATTLLKSTFS